jgi:2-aminoadipate transaminase
VETRISLARRAAVLAPALSASEEAHTIAFDSGHAFPGILPDMTAAAERALTDYRTETLQYGARPGVPEMREWVAGYLNADGARTSAQEVLMTNGAKHAIELVCRLLLDEGDAIIVTAPTYYTAIPLFRSYGATFIEVGQDSEGIDLDAIEERITWLKQEGRRLPKFIYNVPDFHNPTGVTMPRGRREALVGLAARHGMFVVEDSPYRKIRFEGQDEPSLKALDQDGCVLAVGTFSKLLAPGLRVGWVVAPPDLLQRMALLKSDGGSSPLLQRIVLEFCKTGGLEAHTLVARTTYRTHRDHMVRAVRRDLPDATMTVPHGGYYLWLTLPRHIDGDELAKRAKENGVSIFPGSKFYAGQNDDYPRNKVPPKNNIRLNFSHATPEEIDEGVRRLSFAYATVARQTGDAREKAWVAPSA